MKSNRDDFKHVSLKKLSFPFFLIFIFFLFFITINANAGIPRVSARRPLVFSNAAINVVVLQYTYTGKDAERRSETGERLSLLMHQSILYSILKFGSVGAVQIVLDGSKEDNKPEVIFDKILGKKPGALATIKKNHVLVFLWGHIYEEGNAIFVQSYIRFLRHGVSETISMSFSDNLELNGKLPSQAFAFAPRRLTYENLDKINSEFFRNILVRNEPEITASGYPLISERSGLGFGAYSVVEARRGWMRIKPQAEGGREGWIRIDANLGNADLKSYMPELHFVEAVSGYLRYKMTLDGTLEGKIHAGLILRAIMNYLEREVSTRRADNAVALAEVISADLITQSVSDPPAVYIDTLIKLYADAVNLMPYNADARNLLTCANIGRRHINNWENSNPMKFADDFNKSISLDPGNSLVLANLETYYSYLVSLPNSVQLVPQKELKDRLEAVKKVRNEIKKQEITIKAP